MKTNLGCEETRQQFALMLYGELSFDEEERVETHLDGCPHCRQALAQQKELHAALDGIAANPSPALLESSRRSLAASLNRESAERWWHHFLDPLRVQWLKPAGALALLSLGFLGAKLTPEWNLTSGNFGTMSLANVRSVKPQQDGRMQIVFDEKRERTVSGSMDEAPIRQLLIAAARNAQDPELREQTVTILVDGAGAEDIRRELVFALEHDQNPGVRQRVMQSLRPYSHEPAVQHALAEVLSEDNDAGVRTQAIDVLTSRGGGLNRQIIGALQELMSREDDPYVRERIGGALRAIKASSDIY